MIEVHLTVPTSDNAGTTFDPAVDRQFETELVRLFGGFSNPAGLVAGAWVSGGQVYPDQSRIYTVFVAGLLADGPKVMEAVEIAKRLFSQLAITARYLGQAEIL